MKVIICDDQAIIRDGLEMLLNLERDIEVLGQAQDGAEAVELVKEGTPDLVLMDLKMPGMNGIEATRQIKEAYADTAVLALTMHEDDQYFFEMLQAGASGYLPKRDAPDELVRAIRTVSRGEVFLYPSLATRLVQSYVGGEAGDDTEALVSDLTPREKEVLVLIAEGLTNPEIADQLVISVKTVDRHRENIMRKLNLHSRIDLVKYALRHGLIALEE